MDIVQELETRGLLTAEISAAIAKDTTEGKELETSILDQGVKPEILREI